MPRRKFAKNQNNQEIATMDDAEDKAKSFIEKFFGDVSKISATKQIALGTSTGWLDISHVSVYKLILTY
jgi:hypothetical protein